MTDAERINCIDAQIASYRYMGSSPCEDCDNLDKTSVWCKSGSLCQAQQEWLDEYHTEFKRYLKNKGYNEKRIKELMEE